MPDPIYVPANCHAAYQLNWALTVFWNKNAPANDWLTALQAATEPDGIRILSHRMDRPDVSFFFVSTKPHVQPQLVPARIKGRLQHLLGSGPSPFQRNYALRSIGAATRETIDQYLATQLEHHPLADPRVQAELAQYQVHQAQVDLSGWRRTSHALFAYNLHLVLVHDFRWRTVQHEVLQSHHDILLKSSTAHGRLLSRAAILPDHIHVALGCGIAESPESVALSYLNDLAAGCGNTPLFMHSFYTGTFGDYDRGAVRNDR